MQLSETIRETKISQQKDFHIEQFPKVFVPAMNENSLTCLQQFFMKNSESIVGDVRKHGAVLFRDFDIKSPNQAVNLLKQLGFTDIDLKQNFEKFSLVVGSKQKKYQNPFNLSMFESSNCEKLDHFNVHNQFSEINPQFVSVYCFRPALKGGSISLINWSQIYSYTKSEHQDFLSKLQSKGILEIRILAQDENPENTKGNGWRNTFKVANRQEAQKVFKQRGYQFEWLNNQDNQCKLRRRTNFSQQSPSLMVNNNLNELLSLFKECSSKHSNLEDVVTFGDNQKLPIKVLDDILKHSQKSISQIDIQTGDLLVIDHQNIKYMHCPYEGPSELRKVFVSFMKNEFKKQKFLMQTLYNGYKLPLIGFGTWKIPKQKSQDVVFDAIKNGYRLIDCAPVYGNEVQVGKGIKKAIDKDIVKREDLFVTSKLWNTNHSPQNVRPACQRTLKDLGLQYLDLYLMHFPVSLKYIDPKVRYPPEWIYDPESEKPYLLEQKIPLADTWKAMQDLIPTNLVRNIGASNFTVALLRQTINSCQIKPSVLQIQIHPELTQQRFIRYARQQGVQVTSYSTFGATSYVQIGMAEQSEPLYKNEEIINIGKKHNKTPHQIILRWAIQKGIAIIPKSQKSQRMKQNSAIIQFTLPHNDMQIISKLNKNKRYNDPGDFCQKYFGGFYPLHE